jgi:hypothetical protein
LVGTLAAGMIEYIIDTLNWSNALLKRVLHGRGYYAVKFKIAGSHKMADAKREHNRSIKFSTTLTGAVDVMRKQAVQVMRSQAHTRFL